METANHRDRAIRLARKKGVARTRDFDDIGVPRVYLKRLTDDGTFVRAGRGLYHLADTDFSASHSLAQAAANAPRGVIALLSALQFHELTTQTPHQVWMLMPSKAWAPTDPPVQLRVLRASEASLAAGVQHHIIDGVRVPITSPAKTVADCFKYRNKIGADIAIEALADALRQKKASRTDIWKMAAIDRVTNVIRPYLEAQP